MMCCNQQNVLRQKPRWLIVLLIFLQHVGHVERLGEPSPLEFRTNDSLTDGATEKMGHDGEQVFTTLKTAAGGLKKFNLIVNS